MKSWLARKTRLLNSAAGAVAHKLYMWLVQCLRGDYRLVGMIVRWANSNRVDVADLVMKRQVQQGIASKQTRGTGNNCAGSSGRRRGAWWCASRRARWWWSRWTRSGREAASWWPLFRQRDWVRAGRGEVKDHRASVYSRSKLTLELFWLKQHRLKDEEGETGTHFALFSQHGLWVQFAGDLHVYFLDNFICNWFKPKLKTFKSWTIIRTQ